MPRVKTSVPKRARHKKVLKAAKGYWGRRSKWFRRAHETVRRAMRYSYVDRKKRKRDFRGLWIIRINAAARENGLSYSQLMFGLKKAEIEVDRKVLAELAINDPKAFTALAQKAQAALN